MKKLLTLTGIAGIGAVLALLAACQTTGTGDVIAQKEALLAQSGFKDYNSHDPKAATGSESTHCGQGHSRSLQREIVLCVSDWDERQDLLRTPKAIQRL